MAEQSRTPRCLRARTEREMHSDRKNGLYPGRVFYPSSRNNRDSFLSALNGGNYKDNSNNNNIQLFEQTDSNTAEVRELFKELPMDIGDDDINGNTANGVHKCNISTDLNWYAPRGYSSEPHNSHMIPNRNRNSQGVNSSTSRAGSSRPHTLTSDTTFDEWVNAPEFIPQCSSSNSGVNDEALSSSEGATSSSGLYTSDDYACDICAVPFSNSTDRYKRKMHRRLCQQLYSRGPQGSPEALQRSLDKTCGICFETIMEKPIGERRFGILTMCNHCFCLNCIRKWRQARNFENKVVKSCPECRVTSDFVCPSIYWVDTKEEKDLLIQKYKSALSEKHCKYFKQGRGVCPFGNKCFYLHALPNGTKTDVGPPPRRRRHYRPPEDLDLNEMLQQLFLWDIQDEHEHRWLYSFADELEELASFFSDSDESEWSDYDFM